MDHQASADLAGVRAAFVDAIRTGDRGALAQLYDHRARLIAPETELLRGREDVAAFWIAGTDTGVTGVELTPEDVEVMSSVAIEVGRYALRIEPEPGVELVDRGRYLLLYRLDDGRWMRAAELLAPEGGPMR